MCYVSLVGIMMCLKSNLNARSYVRNGRLTAVSEKLESGQSVDKAWKSHFVGVEKPFLGVEHPFKGVDKPWTSRRMPPQPGRHAN